MVDRAISALDPVVFPLDDGDEVAIVQAGETRRATREATGPSFRAGPAGPYLTIQSAVDAAETAGFGTVQVYGRTFTENVLITKPRVHLVAVGGLGDRFTTDDTPTLNGNLTYTLSGGTGSICNIIGLNVLGITSITGAQATLVYCNGVLMENAAASPMQASNSNSTSRYIIRSTTVRSTGAVPAATITGASSIDANFGDNEFTGVDGAGVCISISSSGTGFVGINTRIIGGVVVTGDAGFTLNGVASQIINGVGPCVDRSAGTGAASVFMFGPQLLASGDVVLNPGGDPTKFTYGNTIVFAGDLDATVGTQVSLDGNLIGNQPASRHSVLTVEVFTAADLDALATAGVITVTGELNIDVKAGFTSATRFVMAGGFLNIRGLSGSSIWTYSGTGDMFSGTGNLVIIQQSITSSSTGTLFNMTQTQFNLTIAQNAQFTGFDDLGSQDGGVFSFAVSTFILWSAGLTLSNCQAVVLDGVGSNFDPGSGSLFTLSNTKQAGASARFVDITAILSGTTSLIRVDPAIREDNQIVVINGAISGTGTLFDETGADGTFTAVADAAVASTGIDSVTDSGGVARFNFTVGPTLFVDQEVDITGFVTNTAYNVKAFITATGAGFFEIDTVPFGTDEAVGAFTSDSVTVTDTTTSLVDGDTITIDTDMSTDYDGGATVYNQLVNSFQINRAFTVTQTGSWSGDGLNQEDPRVLAVLQNVNATSRFIASAFVNDNSTANPAIVNNTFTDMAFGTGGSALISGSNIERWKLIDDVTGEFEYTGDEPFDGRITFDFTVISSGGIVDFRFKWVHDIGAGFVDLPDAVEALVAIGNDSLSVTKTFPLAAVKGDRIKPQITRNSGTSSITTQYATIYAAQGG